MDQQIPITVAAVNIWIRLIMIENEACRNMACTALDSAKTHFGSKEVLACANRPGRPREADVRVLRHFSRTRSGAIY
jgi:hypothetical protein